NGLGGFVARAFQTQGSQSVLVSTRTLTADNTPGATAGAFSLALRDSFDGNPITAAPTTVQLTPVGSADPWFTFNPFMLSAGGTDTDLGSIKLPVYSKLNSFQVTVHGTDPMEIVGGATVRAFTSLAGGDPRGSAAFLRDATADATGVATLMLIPGDSNVARMY